MTMLGSSTSSTSSAAVAAVTAAAAATTIRDNKSNDNLVYHIFAKDILVGCEYNLQQCLNIITVLLQ